MPSKDGFILKYGNGKAILTMREGIRRLEGGTKKLIFDDGTEIEFFYSPIHYDNQMLEILEKYGEWGVREIRKSYSRDKIFIGELTEEQKQYV